MTLVVQTKDKTPNSCKNISTLFGRARLNKEIDVLQRICLRSSLKSRRGDSDGKSTAAVKDQQQYVRTTRNEALFLAAYWSGFQFPLLSSLRVTHLSDHHDLCANSVLFEEKGPLLKRLGNVIEFAPPTRLIQKSFDDEFCDVCPRRAIFRWLTLAGIKHGWVFRNIDRWGNFRQSALDPNSISRILREMIIDAGYEPPMREGPRHSRLNFAVWRKANMALGIVHGTPFAGGRGMCPKLMTLSVRLHTRSQERSFCQLAKGENHASHP